jgi:8-oxo-dGTP diphosphatase
MRNTEHSGESNVLGKKYDHDSAVKPLHVAAAVIKNAQGQILISLRNRALHQGGLWEFPGGKVEPGETPEQALKRELKEELDIMVSTSTPLITVSHQYPDLAVLLHVYLVRDFLGIAKGCEGQPLKWVDAEVLSRYEFPAANQPIITAARLPAYYAILDDADVALLMVNLKKILNRGVKLIQARLKRLPPDAVKAFLERAHPLCKKQGALLLMNSDAKFSEGRVFNDLDSAFTEMHQIHVDGLHLTSLHLMAKNRRPENVQWLAASCHSLEELQHAERIGVDFAVLAPVFSTQTHPGVNPLGWEQFEQLVSKTNLPVFALGGMTEAFLSKAQEAGGQGIAAIRAFLG